MDILNIQLNNFRSFLGTHTFNFRKLNLITGRIGKGKSSLGLYAPLFAIYGYSESKISNLVTKGQKDSYVTLTVKKNNDIIKIKREVPTKVSLWLNDLEILKDANNTEKDKWLIEKFNNLEYFKKFHMIDLKQGVNILEDGKVALKKTLINFEESLLNNIRQSILDKKNLYEKYNKDELVIYKHYPSEKRKRILEEGIELHQSLLQSTNSSSILADIYGLQSDLKNLKSELKEKRDNKQELLDNPTCYTCKQKLPNSFKINLLEKLKNQIIKLKKQLVETESKLPKLEEKYKKLSKVEQNHLKNRQRLESLLSKLEIRFKQKQYKYSNKDILVASRAIKELDKFYSYFVMENVKTLEPIINNIVEKIGFSFNFDIDDKGSFGLKLYKEGEEYSYSELSSGQKLMLSIAVKISILLNKGDTGFIIADEGFSALDIQSIENLFELLSETPMQYIIILHRFDLVPATVNLINVEELNAKKNEVFV